MGKATVAQELQLDKCATILWLVMETVMSDKEMAIADNREAMRHLHADGLPPYPPAEPWPDIAHEFVAGPLWVFGYGSLIWNPGFPSVERKPAVVHGYHRRLCVWSWEYRGTVDYPGLVLGLDRGGSCQGIAFRVDESQKRNTVAYLLRREVPVSVYRPRRCRVTLQDGRKVLALTFVVMRHGHQYAGHLPLAQVRDVVASARGVRGGNDEYVLNTHRHLQQLGIPCKRLEQVISTR